MTFVALRASGTCLILALLNLDDIRLMANL